MPKQYPAIMITGSNSSLMSGPTRRDTRLGIGSQNWTISGGAIGGAGGGGGADGVGGQGCAPRSAAVPRRRGAGQLLHCLQRPNAGGEGGEREWSWGSAPRNKYTNRASCTPRLGQSCTPRPSGVGPKGMSLPLGPRPVEKVAQALVSGPALLSQPRCTV